MKVVPCRDEVKQFAKKYLILNWIDATEIKSGILLKFPFGEVDSCKLIGSTDACVACSSVFTRPFSNYRVRNFRLLLITRERLGLAT